MSNKPLFQTIFFVKYTRAMLGRWPVTLIADRHHIRRSLPSSAQHPAETNDFESHTIMWTHAPQEQCGLWMCWVACLAYRARAALSERARTEGVRGLWMLTIWPLGGWFPHWLPLFLANNWDLIWLGWGVKTDPCDTPAAIAQVCLLSLKGVISLSVLLCEGWGPATRPFFFSPHTWKIRRTLRRLPVSCTEKEICASDLSDLQLFPRPLQVCLKFRLH